VSLLVIPFFSLVSRVVWSLTLRDEHKLRVFENGIEENIWTIEGWSDGRVEKTA
jgi:hypothetical protein